jgi:hypothetical protein
LLVSREHKLKIGNASSELYIEFLL